MMKVTLRDGGGIEVDIELPEGRRCDEVDAAFRATLAALGMLGPEDAGGHDRIAQVDGAAVKERERVKR